MTPPQLVRLGLSIIIAAALTATASSSVAARMVYFTVEGGGALPSGPETFQNLWSEGFGGAAGVHLDAGSNIFVIGRIEYYRFAWETGSTQEDFGNLGAFLIGMSTAFAFFDEDDAYRPFLLAGYGTADLSRSGGSDAIQTEWDSGDLRGFFQLGGGIDFRLNDALRLQLTGRYISVNGLTGGESNSFFPITLGLRF